MKKNILLSIIFLSLVFARRDCLQYAHKDALGRYERPIKDVYSVSPSSHFYIHFDTTGNAAPDLTDSDGNGVPDYVDEVGIIADSARHVLVDELGYNDEPFDGDGGYDIYILYTTISHTQLHNIKILPHVGYDDMFDMHSNFTSYRNIPIQFATPFVPLSYIYYHPHDSDLDIDNKVVEFGCNLDNCITFKDNEYLVNWNIKQIRKDRAVVEGGYYGNIYKVVPPKKQKIKPTTKFKDTPHERVSKATIRGQNRTFKNQGRKN